MDKSLSDQFASLQATDGQGHKVHNPDGGNPPPPTAPPVPKSALELFQASADGHRPNPPPGTGGPVFTAADPNSDVAVKVKAIADGVQAHVRDALGRETNELIVKALKAVDGRLDALDADQKAYIADRVKAALIETMPQFAGGFQPIEAVWKGWNPVEFATKSQADPRAARSIDTRGARSIDVPRVNPLFTRAAVITDQQDVPGGYRDALDPWTVLVTGNPFRMDSMIVTLTGGTATLPNIGAIAFTRENDLNTGRAGASSRVVGASDVTLDTYTAETWASNVALNDIPMLREIVEFEMMQQAAYTEGAAAFAALKASAVSAAAASISQVTSGVANTLPTAENVWGKIVDMIAEVPSPYRRRAKFHISRALEALLHKATSGSDGWYAFNPARRMMTIAGYPVTVNDHCEDGGAANNVSGLFGDFYAGLICATGTPMLIAEEYEQTRPGAMTYFSQIRTVGHVRDATGLTGLVTKV